MILGNERPAEDLFGNSDHLLCESDQTWVERLFLLLKLHQYLQNERQHSLQVSLLQKVQQICQRLNIYKQVWWRWRDTSKWTLLLMWNSQGRPTQLDLLEHDNSLRRALNIEHAIDCCKEKNKKRDDVTGRAAKWRSRIPGLDLRYWSSGQRHWITCRTRSAFLLASTAWIWVWWPRWSALARNFPN